MTPEHDEGTDPQVGVNMSNNPVGTAQANPPTKDNSANEKDAALEKTKVICGICLTLPPSQLSPISRLLGWVEVVQTFHCFATLYAPLRKTRR